MLVHFIVCIKFQLKHGLRKLNPLSRFLVSSFRISTVLGCAYYAATLKKLDITNLAKFTNIFELSSQTLNVIYLSLALVVLNFFIRLSVRFLAAMRMHLLNVLHPAFILPPLLAILPYITCYKFPICFLNVPLKPFDLNLQCLRWSQMDPNVFIYEFAASVLWILIYLVWSFNYISRWKVRKMEEA